MDLGMRTAFVVKFHIIINRLEKFAFCAIFLATQIICTLYSPDIFSAAQSFCRNGEFGKTFAFLIISIIPSSFFTFASSKLKLRKVNPFRLDSACSCW